MVFLQWFLVWDWCLSYLVCFATPTFLNNLDKFWLQAWRQSLPLVWWAYLSTKGYRKRYMRSIWWCRMIYDSVEWHHFSGMWKLKSAFLVRRVMNRYPFRGEIQTGSVMHQNTCWWIWRRRRRRSQRCLTSGYEIWYAHMWSHFFMCPPLYHLVYSVCFWIDYSNHQRKK